MGNYKHDSFGEKPQGAPWWPKWVGFWTCTALAQVQSLVMELRSHSQHSTAKKEDKEKFWRQDKQRKHQAESNHEASKKTAGFQEGHPVASVSPSLREQTSLRSDVGQQQPGGEGAHLVNSRRQTRNISQ